MDSGDVKRIPLIHQTMFAELIARSMDAEFNEQFPENGSFRQLESNGRAYWYYVGYVPARTPDDKPTRPQKYVGPVDDPEISARVAAFSEMKADYRARRSMVASLQSAGLPSPVGRVGEVVEALSRAGLFRVRGVLIGTVAFQSYCGLLGMKVPKVMSVTGDADFAQFYSVSVLIGDSTPPLLEVLRKVDPSFRELPHLGNTICGTKFRNGDKFEVEFLVPNRGSDDNQAKPTVMPALGNAGAEPLRFLDFLIYHPVRSVLLHKAGVSVSVPAPERYAIHKLIVATRRKSDGAGRLKSAKDVAQSGALLRGLKLEGRGVDAGFAWMEAWERGDKWKKLLSAGAKRLALQDVELIRALVSEACESDGKNPEDYGLMDSQNQPKL